MYLVVLTVLMVLLTIDMGIGQPDGYSSSEAYIPGKIVGGTKAPYYPFMVKILLKKNDELYPHCGGAILKNNSILTAAHCMENPENEIVVQPISKNGTYTIEKIVLHESYNPRTFENDVSLLKLSEPIEFNKDTMPISLPESDADYIGKTAIVAGWGKTTENGEDSSYLQQVEVPILDRRECKVLYEASKKPIGFNEGKICAGYKEGGKDSCQGDSGGPLFITNNGNHKVIGVVSNGVGCARENLPGIYTYVPAYVNWIYDKME